MYDAKTINGSLLRNGKLVINFCDKVKLLTYTCPNPKIRRFIKKGIKRLDEDLDIMDIIKQHKYHHEHLKEVDENIIKEHPLDIDNDSDEEEQNNLN